MYVHVWMCGRARLTCLLCVHTACDAGHDAFANRASASGSRRGLPCWTSLRGDFRGFLASLPLFFSDHSETMPDCEQVLLQYQSAVHQLVRDRVNCAAAMEVNGFIADTVAYPLLVLLHATASAEALPAVFFLDVVQGLLHSVLNEHAFVQLGRWESRSRYWTVGAASVGEGKSPCMKPLMQAMQRVLEKHLALAVGHASAGFHYQHLRMQGPSCEPATATSPSTETRPGRCCAHPWLLEAAPTHINL